MAIPAPTDDPQTAAAPDRSALPAGSASRARRSVIEPTGDFDPRDIRAARRLLEGD